MSRQMLTLLLLVGFSTAISDGADIRKMIEDVHARNSGTLATIRFTFQDETGSRTVSGLAVCIGAKGVFMTLVLDSRVSSEAFKDFQIVSPGVDGKVTKAKLLGIDPGTGLGFVQAIGEKKWPAVKFAVGSPKVGQPVVSIGLMSKDPSFPTYMGTGYVSSVLRVPGKLVYVTGGKLTTRGSPVFDAQGRAIGIVAEQLASVHQTVTNRGRATLALTGEDETSYFTPVEEFAHVLRNIPAGGKARRLPWLGIGKFEWVNDATAKLRKLDRPGIMIDQVIPAHPAATVGLKSGDIIVGLDGRNIEKFATGDLTVRNFRKQIIQHAIGDKVKLKVLSGGTMRDVTIKLTSMPKLPAEAKRYFSRPLGFVVREKVALDRYIDTSPTAEVAGLIVFAVANRSPAARDGLRAGDLIVKVNDLDVTTVTGIKGIVERAITENPNKSIDFLVQRGNQAQKIRIRPPQR